MPANQPAGNERALIRSLSETLQNLLLGFLPELQEDKVRFDSPGDIAKADENLLSIFLYQIQFNPFLRNEQRETLPNNFLRSPPMALELNYMITPYAKKVDMELLFLERIAVAMHENSLLERDQLTPPLAQNQDEIRINPLGLNLEELNKIWGMFGSKSYKTALFYNVSPLYLPSDQVWPFAKGATIKSSYEPKTPAQFKAELALKKKEKQS